jgi:hypothetical protein
LPPTILDQVIELFDARLAAIIDFAGGAWPEATGMYSEDECSEGIGIFVIEGAIDEYVYRGSGFPSRPMVICRRQNSTPERRF